ncbi:MAG TPA: hypothetical protein VK980_04640 [Sphingomonas sp.]|nr:hypothetical protein [Sphingomonas sp.]
MARVSIASLLDGGGSPIVTVPDSGDTNHVAVGQHGMIANLYSSGSLASVTLDFALAAVPTTLAGDVVSHDLFDTVAGGDVHVRLADLLQGEAGSVASGGTPLGFAGEQHVPDDVHVTIAGQSALGSFEGPRVVASIDNFAVAGMFELGHHEMGMFLGGDGLPAPISEQHFIA